MIAQMLIHSKHMYLVCLEYGNHLLVAAYPTFIFGKLKRMGLDVVPDSFDDKRAGELRLVVSGRSIFGG